MSIWILWLLFDVKVQAQVSFTEPDGMNGYYTKIPTVSIQYDGNGITKYRFKNKNGIIMTGKLDEYYKEITIPKEYFIEGTNYLDIWNEQEESIHQIKFMIDQSSPECPVLFEEGNGLKITAKDKISGIAGIYFAMENEKFQYVKGSQAFITLPNGLEGKISAYAVDLAGNLGECAYFSKKKKESIVRTSQVDDMQSPSISLEGNWKSQITNSAAMITFKVTDNGLISKVSAQLQKVDLDGEICCDLSDWEKVEQGYCLEHELKEDGIYKFTINAKDEEGNDNEMTQQVILDSTPPVFHSLEEIEGKVLTEFQWDFDTKRYITDLTSLYCEVRIDGILYEKGVSFKESGKHILEIYAKDLAGNESRKTIAFYIAT